MYTLGKIAGHNVVATKVSLTIRQTNLPDQSPISISNNFFLLQLSMIGGDRMAATSAGSITTRLLGTFQHVDHVIIVGIGGGVPHYTDPEMVCGFSAFVICKEKGKSRGRWSENLLLCQIFVAKHRTSNTDKKDFSCV